MVPLHQYWGAKSDKEFADWGNKFQFPLPTHAPHSDNPIPIGPLSWMLGSSVCTNTWLALLIHRRRENHLFMRCSLKELNGPSRHNEELNEFNVFYCKFLLFPEGDVCPASLQQWQTKRQTSQSAKNCAMLLIKGHYTHLRDNKWLRFAANEG